MCTIPQKKGKDDTKGDSQIIRAAVPTTDPGERASSSSASKGGATSPVLAGQDTSAQYLEGRVPTEVCGGRALWS